MPRNYYSNPAFSQQSEFYPPKSPVRQSPVGALQDVTVPLEEQDFYEEMLVDDHGHVKEKKIVVVSSDARNTSGNHVVVDQNGSRYAMVPLEEPTKPKTRYEYIPMVEHDVNQNNSHPQPHSYHTPTHSPTRKKEQVSPRNQLALPRYQLEQELIPSGYKEEAAPSPRRQPVIPRYQLEQELIPSGYKEEAVPSPRRQPAIPRYQLEQELLPTGYREEEYQLSNGRVHRYAVISVDEDLEELEIPRYRTTIRPPLTPKNKSKPSPNPAATQKLYELLSTPKKRQTPRTQVTPSKRPLQPKAQQRLNYGGSRQFDKRTTAIVAPMCASPPQSVYSETTFSQKSESWMNVSGKKQPVHITLTIASLMMVLSGGLASTLCFYMVSMLGRLYYLDFGIVAGFACLVLGVLGFRARHYYYWLPNRNYMSGYIILTLFSLLTCVGLLLLLYLQPKPGTPLADMTSGAVCGISALSLIFASAGVAASYCCKLPPPDNRVEHCARGFTV